MRTIYVLNQIALLGLIGQAAALGSQIRQSVGVCGNAGGACITMTPVDNNPKGSFISATPCSDSNSLQTWTFDPTNHERAYLLRKRDELLPLLPGPGPAAHAPRHHTDPCE
jgi:hypothetical protein